MTIEIDAGRSNERAMPMTLSDARHARMELEFPPDWRVLHELRVFVNKLVFTVADSDELAQRVSMVVTELAENAVKYAENHTALVRLRVQPTLNGIRCETENLANPTHIDDLQRTLEKVNEGDAEEAYARALLEACDEVTTSSRVGLARIRTEGGMKLSCVVNDSTVRIIAELVKQ